MQAISSIVAISAEKKFCRKLPAAHYLHNTSDISYGYLILMHYCYNTIHNTNPNPTPEHFPYILTLTLTLTLFLILTLLTLTVNDISQCCQRTEPWPQATCPKNLVKFGCAVYELCKWKDRQTDILITILHTPPKCKVIITEFYDNYLSTHAMRCC